LHGRQKLSSKGNLSLGTFTRLKAFIPSSINETDLKTIQKKQLVLAAQGLNPMINFFWDWVTSIDFQKSGRKPTFFKF
jgi:iron complex outermembrane receptor protein